MGKSQIEVKAPVRYAALTNFTLPYNAMECNMIFSTNLYTDFCY